MIRSRMLRATLCALLLLPAALSAARPSDDVAVHELANGMRIIVKPDRRAPVAVSMVWYRVGSMDEHNGITGVAHVLEHMMFKGTRSVPAGEFSRLIANAGGRDNAFTSRDYTAYFQTLQKSALPLALRLEADRMRNLVITPEEFAKEIKVVMEERRWRTDDRPQAVVYERLMASALKAHPYRHPVIGWMSDLETLTVEDTRRFYDQWYAPNNAILVVVGDVQPAEVFALAERHFGRIPRKALPERKTQAEPPQLGIQRLTVKVPAEQAQVLMAWRVPRLQRPSEEWEPYALDMLQAILSGNAAARLPQRLVKDERIAVTAGAGYDGIGRGPAFFLLAGTPAPGRSAAELEAALRRELQRVIDEGVIEAELNRVRAQIISGNVYQRDSMFFQARMIGALDTVGLSFRDQDLFIERLQQISSEQIREVARKYLVDDQLTIAYLDPQPMAGAPPRAAPPAGARHGN
ncbi:MAG: M16 family metallopeptidase [Betaproteobacteria bacterium]